MHTIESLIVAETAPFGLDDVSLQDVRVVVIKKLTDARFRKFDKKRGVLRQFIVGDFREVQLTESDCENLRRFIGVAIKEVLESRHEYLPV